MATKRIIELTEGTVASGDYVMTDSATSGTKKVNLQAALDAASADPASSTPLMDGTAAVGTSDAYARGDHRHPTDTSRAPLASPALTGTPTAPTASSGTSTTQLATTAFVAGEVASAKEAIWSNRPAAIIAGSLVTADDAAPTTPIALSVYGQSVQDGTPTPSAPVPIVSVEGDEDGNISLKAQGLNWLDPAIARGGANKGITVSEPDANGWLTISGTSDATSAGVITMWGMTDARTIPRGVYTLLLETEGTPFVESKVRLQVYGTRESGGATYITEAGPYTMDYTENGIDRVSVHVASSSSGTTVDGRFRLTLVSGTIAPTAYIPYVGSVTPIDLDGHELRSLPDGTRDELTVDAEGHVTLVQRVGVVTLDGTESVGAGSTDRRIWRIAPSAPAYNTGAISDNLLCDRFERTTAGNASMADGTVKLTGTSATAERQFYFRRTACTTAEEFAAWLANNPTTVLYPLATPVTHDLGTVPLVPLVGPDLTAQMVPTAPFVLTYERDATIVLDRLTAMWANIAPVEGDTASASYSVGSYLMHGGQLCKVTTAIATGEAITIGTNVTATTVMAEVIALTQ